MRVRTVIIAAVVCIVVCGCGNPVKKWKQGFDDVVHRITAIPTEGDEVKNYDQYFRCSEELAFRSQDSQYAKDLLKDMLLTAEPFIVRAAAAEALGHPSVGRRDDAYVLMSGLSDPSAFVRERTYKALKRLTHEDFGTDKDRWLQWWKREEEKRNAE